MKKSLRRGLCAALAVAALVSGAYALNAGDSLITLSFLTETFFPSAVSAGKQQVSQQLQQTYDGVKQELDDAQKELLGLAAGEEGLYSAVLAPKGWSDGDTVTLPTGAGFLMQEGTAVISHQGAVVDVTQGEEVASGSRLKADHRYLVGEDTVAKITVLSGAARLGVQGNYTYTPGRSDPTPFYDVCQTDWYYGAVGFVYKNGLFAGMSEHEFGPDTVMNRAMVMTVFYNLAGAPADQMAASQASFSDVPEDAWFAPFVKWAYCQQITAGTSPTTFTPGQLINREQMVTLLYSFASRFLGLELTARQDLSAFADAETISAWAREPMSWAVAEGIIGSVSSDSMVIAPHAQADRANVASMLSVFSEIYR